MADYTVPVRGEAFVFYCSLVSQADTKTYQSNPTLAAGDAQVSKDGGTLANLATLPTVTPASGKLVKVSLSADEMTADNVVVIFSDAAGAQWCDYTICVQTATRGVDDLAYPATSGRSLAVDASGQVDVRALADGSVTAAAVAAGAIDADAIADGAIDAGAVASATFTSAKFAVGAIDAAALAADAANEVADALLDRASAVDAYTVRQILRGVAAVLLGKVSGAPGAEVFRAADDSANRVTATTTSDGNRTAVVLSLGS